MRGKKAKALRRIARAQATIFRAYEHAPGVGPLRYPAGTYRRIYQDSKQAA